MEASILLTDSIHAGVSYKIVGRFMNGIVMGRHEDRHIACHMTIIKHTVSLHPVVGKFSPGIGWIFPDTDGYWSYDTWRRDLRHDSLLVWRRRLRAHIELPAMVKVRIDDYALDDLTILRDSGWFVGRSAHAPLWRIYALIPESLFVAGDLPALSGDLAKVERFGAIFNPARHTITVKFG